MSELSQINVDGTTYELQDASARQLITQNANAIAELQESVSQINDSISKKITFQNGQDAQMNVMIGDKMLWGLTANNVNPNDTSSLQNKRCTPIAESDGLELWNGTDNTSEWKITSVPKVRLGLGVTDGYINANTSVGQIMQIGVVTPTTNYILTITNTGIGLYNTKTGQTEHRINWTS